MGISNRWSGSIHMSDDLWVARWLLERICEKNRVEVSLHPKPVEGDWNGGMSHQLFHKRNERRWWYRTYNVKL